MPQVDGKMRKWRILEECAISYVSWSGQGLLLDESDSTSLIVLNPNPFSIRGLKTGEGRAKRMKPTNII